MVDAPTDDVPPAGSSTARRTLAAFIGAFALASIAYRIAYTTGYQQTAALYVGVPAVLAIALTFVGTGKSAIGMLLKGSMIALLLAGVVLPEGLICLLFAAPLVALVALVVGGAIDLARHYLKGNDTRTRVIVAIPLAIMSMEGVIGTPFDTRDHATATRVVALSASEVHAALAAEPRFGEVALPTFLKLGFNRPIGAAGAGLEPGDERTIHFTGGNHDDHPLRLFGVTGTRGVDHHSMQRLRVASATDRRVVFDVVEDTTMTIRWAALRRSTVTWDAVDATHTRITWRIDYERLLHPAFYFAPLQRLAASEAAGYLIDSVVTSSP